MSAAIWISRHPWFPLTALLAGLLVMVLSACASAPLPCEPKIVTMEVAVPYWQPPTVAPLPAPTYTVPSCDPAVDTPQACLTPWEANWTACLAYAARLEARERAILSAPAPSPTPPR